jgi:UDP-glucose 4-epimerase
MNILFTGASSFTGYWFASTLALHGHKVICPLRGTPGGYEGVRKRRVEMLQKTCQIVPEAPFGSERFMSLLREIPVEILCHHAADVTDYKSPAFDINRALQNNTLNARAVLASLKERGAKGMVLTGSVFENGEGEGGDTSRAFSPYGVSKALTAQIFQWYCHEARLPLGKFVIPNPFGPLEEPRFTAYLMKTWREGKSAAVKTPDYVRDNIHVDLLAGAYEGFVRKVSAPTTSYAKINPSGYIESQGEFTLRVAGEVRSRTNWACEVQLSKQEDFAEPMIRTNTEPATQTLKDWNESAAWDSFVNFYRAGT